jgi:hypothetical protein
MNVAQGIAAVLLSGMLSAVAHAQAPALDRLEPRRVDHQARAARLKQ